MVGALERERQSLGLEWPAEAEVSHDTSAAVSIVSTTLAGLEVHCDHMGRGEALAEGDGRGDVRRDHAVRAFWREVERRLLARLRGAGERAEWLAALADDVAAGRHAPSSAAWRVLDGAGDIAAAMDR